MRSKNANNCIQRFVRQTTSCIVLKMLLASVSTAIKVDLYMHVKDVYLLYLRFSLARLRRNLIYQRYRHDVILPKFIII
jgi:hypothetical protein